MCYKWCTDRANDTIATLLTNITMFVGTLFEKIPFQTFRFITFKVFIKLELCIHIIYIFILIEFSGQLLTNKGKVASFS